MAAESGDMPQRGIFLQGVHHLVTRDERPEGHAPAEGLGQTDDVGRDAVFLHGEQAARAAHAGLYLVENQQRADFVAASAQRIQITRTGRTDAGLALHRLGQHTGRAARNALQFGEIVELHGLHVGQQGPERPLPLLALGRTHHAHRAVRRPVVGAAHGDDLRTPGKTFRQFQSPLDRLGARVDEIDAFERRGQQRRDPGGILHLRRLDQLAVDHHMHVARSLLLHGAHHGRIAVTDIADRNPGHEVEITLAFGRIEKRAFGARDLHQHRRRGGLGDMRQKLFAENHTILSICADSGQERRSRL